MIFVYILIILILIYCILYFIYRNKEYNKILESFDNIDNIDQDTVYTNPINNNSILDDKWTGIWGYNDTLYAQFIQNNDKLIISFSNSKITPYNLNNIFSKKNLNGITSLDFCIPNLFLGIGILNNDRNVFNLTEVYCSNYLNSGLNLTVNNLSGKIENDKITLYSNLNSTNYNKPLLLNKIKDFSYSGVYKYDQKYLKDKSKFIRLFPEIPDSEGSFNGNFCKKYNNSDNGNTANIVQCLDTNSGLVETTFNGSKINACGVTNGQDNNCIGTPKCVIYPSTSIERCDLTFNNLNMSQENNFAPMNGLINNSNKSLKICNYLEDFIKGKINSCILCYINNLGEVKTLDYQFFGVNNKENNVVLQNDYMQDYLNKNLLQKYNKLINSDISSINKDLSQNIDLVKAFSFTNLIEDNNDGNTLRIQLEKNFYKIKDFINNNNNKQMLNSNLLPCVWQINYDKNLDVIKKNNLSNSCAFTLSTSLRYNNQVKYIEINDDELSLSLYPSGINKQLMCENVKIISKSQESSVFKFIAFTANIKGNNNLYLIPSEFKGSVVNNSSNIKMKKENEINGKWLILGFNLTDINQLKLMLEQIIL